MQAVSLIIFYVQRNTAAVALDCDVLSFSKETYHHFNNFAHVSRFDKQHAVKVLQQLTSSRLNCYPLCGESWISLEKEEKQRRTNEL